MLRNLKTPLKSITVLSFVLLAAPFIKPEAALAGGFARSCVDEKIVAGAGGLVWLLARCTQTDGAIAPARLRISDHIANRNGQLAWGGGGFHRSCRGVKYLSPGTAMFAECGNGRGGWRATVINLNDKISNQDGVLAIDR